jgi:hypothetical protein
MIAAEQSAFQKHSSNGPIEGDDASGTFWALPQLIVARSKLAAKARAERFAITRGLFKQGSQVVRILHSPHGDRVERLPGSPVNSLMFEYQALLSALFSLLSLTRKN